MSEQDKDSIIKVAKIHEQRLLEALAAVDSLFPFNADKVKNIKKTDFFALETLTSRFSRLQDLMGSKLFDLCLVSLGESIDGLSMIDKANKLEKTGTLDSAHWWMEMRRLRNNVTHEYPDQPEITADILNHVHTTIAPMLALFNKMLATIDKSEN